MNDTYTTIHRTVCGSYLHRTHGPQSDVDRRSIYMLPLKQKLAPLTTQPRTNQAEDTAYELGHFATMAVKNNPTALEIGLGDLYETGGTLEPTIVNWLTTEALDTEQFTKQANGFVFGLLNERTQTAKRRHHAVRVLTLLEIYHEYGILDFNTENYPNRELLLAIKYEEAPIGDVDFSKRVPRKTWHVTNHDVVQDIVSKLYLGEELK